MPIYHSYNTDSGLDLFWDYPPRDPLLENRSKDDHLAHDKIPRTTTEFPENAYDTTIEWNPHLFMINQQNAKYGVTASSQPHLLNPSGFIDFNL